MKDDVSILVLAGGLGKRLRPLTFSIPKPMININGEPLISHLLKRLNKYDFKEFIISTGYLSEIIKDFCKDGSKFKSKISYLDEDTPLGTAGPLGLVDINKINKTLLVINGDIITDLNFKSFYDFHKSKNASITVAVKEYVLESRYGTVEIDLDKISKIKEKPKYNNLISTGIYLIEKEALKNFPKSKIDMPDFINRLISKNKKIVYYRFAEKWTPVEEIDDIKEAELTT